MFVTPKFCVSIVFSFSLGHFNSQEKLKTMLMQNFVVTNKEHMVCYGIFWSGQLDFSTIKLPVITIRCFFYYNLISFFTTNRFFMSISFFLMYVFQFFLFPLRGHPAWIQVSRSPLSLLDINLSLLFLNFFLSWRHISFSLILPKKIWNM